MCWHPWHNFLCWKQFSGWAYTLGSTHTGFAILHTFLHHGYLFGCFGNSCPHSLCHLPSKLRCKWPWLYLSHEFYQACWVCWEMFVSIHQVLWWYNICSTKTTLWKTIVGHCPINTIRYHSYISTKRAHSSTILIKDEGSTQFPITVWASWSWRHVLPCTWSVHKNEIIDAVSRQLCIQFYTKSWPFVTSTKENSTTKEQKSVKPGQAKLLDDSDDKLNVRQMLHHRGNRLFCYVEQLPGHTQNEQKCPSTCQPQPHQNTANGGNSKTLRKKRNMHSKSPQPHHNIGGFWFWNCNLCNKNDLQVIDI